MHRESRRGRSRAPLIVGIVVVVALIGGAVWYFFLSGESSILGPDVPEFSFEIGKVSGQPVTKGTTADQEEMTAAAEDVRETLDAMYVAGFIDPSKWEKGFPEVLEAFTEEAAARAEEDISSLTLGDDAVKVESVQPESSRLSVRFLLDEDQALSAAVARAQFAAGGQLENGQGLVVQHDATYYMRPDGDAWLIEGWQVHGIVTIGAPAGEGEGQ